jgi:hypothetical protein
MWRSSPIVFAQRNIRNSFQSLKIVTPHPTP